MSAGFRGLLELVGVWLSSAPEPEVVEKPLAAPGAAGRVYKQVVHDHLGLVRPDSFVRDFLQARSLTERTTRR
jgi:hypothetical protein